MQENEIYCNRCGKKMDVFDVDADIVVEHRCSYGSDYDGETVKIRLCCDCFDEWIRECINPPVV